MTTSKAYTYDGENRLIRMLSLSATPSNSWRSLTFAYDPQGRRISKVVSNWTGSAWSLVLSNKFLYDGWNLIAELSGTNNTVIRSYSWGTDLSGTIQGAGVVGGLLMTKDSAGMGYFVAYDGNGNVSALVNAVSGTTSAEYGYGPFGEVLRATGLMARANPLRFSTKYQDDETDLLYYGYRYYASSTGRWLSRDPASRGVPADSYTMLLNCPESYVDLLGLYAVTFGTSTGPLSASWKKAITTGFDNVDRYLDRYLHRKTGGMPPLITTFSHLAANTTQLCCKKVYSDISVTLTHLHEVFVTMRRNLKDTWTVAYDPDPAKLAEGVDAYTLTLNPFRQRWIYFVDKDADPSRIVFHEMLHLAGVPGDEGMDTLRLWLDNAHAVTLTYSDDLSVNFGNLFAGAAGYPLQKEFGFPLLKACKVMELLDGSHER
jgi:RHS repeat-associated protein